MSVRTSLVWTQIAESQSSSKCSTFFPNPAPGQGPTRFLGWPRAKTGSGRILKIEVLHISKHICVASDRQGSNLEAGWVFKCIWDHLWLQPSHTQFLYSTHLSESGRGQLWVWIRRIQNLQNKSCIPAEFREYRICFTVCNSQRTHITAQCFDGNVWATGRASGL